MSNTVEILIADDHELFRRTLRSFIETQLQWHVCGEAGDGVEAVDKAKLLRPDVVLMDINMPRMDGLEATRILRRELPACKVVIVTQNHTSIARQQAASVEAGAAVTKGDLTRDLRGIVETVLGASQSDPSEIRPEAEEEWVRGGGVLGSMVREFDWTKTPLGPIEKWPMSLKIAMRILLTSRFAMWMSWGPELTFLYNDAYAKMTLGKKHPWALGKPSREVWKEIWDDIGPRIDRVFKTGQATWDEGLLLFLERSGYREETYHTFSYSPLSGEDGKICGHLCVVTEETDRVIGERRLNTLRSLSAELNQTSSDADVIACITRVLGENQQDLAFTLTYFFTERRHARLACKTGIPDGHPAAPELINLAADDAPWPFAEILNSKDFFLVEDLKLFSSVPSGVWEDPPTRAILLPVTSQTQESPAGVMVVALNPYRPLDVSYVGFLNLVAGQIAASISNARAYQEERKRAEALAEIDRAKTAFFSNVSHEFRTPLTLMLGPLQDLLSRSQTHLSPTAAQQLELVNRNGARLLRLVNTLLDFSRIEAGRVKAVYQATDVAAFTAELAGVFRSATERAGLQLIVDCHPTEEIAYVDRDMWEKIVLNLVSNAFKFTFEGEIEVSLTQVGHTAELRVRDTGVGIPPEEMSHLFDRFHRVPNTRSRTHEGTGIGLALVHELVKIHGGSMHGESVLGRGTTFFVSIPLGQAHLASEQVGGERTLVSTAIGANPFVEEALRWLPDDAVPGDEELLPLERDLLPVPCPPSFASALRRRVLIADDNSDMRQYLLRLLSERYEVVAVADGELALESVRKQTPDLVLSDIMMPNLDGFGLLAALRSNSETSTIPVILLSARAGEESRVEGMDAGADDYLIKPFSARELLARVQNHLELSRVRREAHELLRKSEERLRAFVTASADVIYRMNPDWTHMYSLEGQEFVADRTDVTGSWTSRYIHPDDRPRVLSAIQEAIRTKDILQLEHRVLRADGSLGWTSSRAIPLLGERGEIVEWFGAASDITARKQMEERLRDTQTELALRVQERTAELERVQADVRDLSGKLLQLQDEERRRLARDLHDSAGQTLAVLGMNLGQLEQWAATSDGQFAEKVREAQELLRRVTQEVRTTSYLLHPPLLDESGLPAALRLYVEGLAQRTHLKLELSVSEEFGRLPKETELAMFRMVQECLTNILRHADSDTAEIRVLRTAGEVTLEIQDHGKGIANDKLAAIHDGKSGVGIRGMRDRVRHLNGQMNVLSGELGTTVSISLPIVLQDLRLLARGLKI